jgi:hypothetical protein
MVRYLRRTNGDNSAFLVAKVGAPTSWMRAPEQIARVRSFDPTVVIVMGGTNDLTANTEEALDRARANLAAVAGSLDARVIVATVPPRRGAAGAITAAYDAQLLGRGVPGARVEDVGGALSLDDLGADGVRPTVAGSERLGDALGNAAVAEPGLVMGLFCLGLMVSPWAWF